MRRLLWAAAAGVTCCFIMACSTEEEPFDIDRAVHMIQGGLSSAEVEAVRGSVLLLSRDTPGVVRHNSQLLTEPPGHRFQLDGIEVEDHFLIILTTERDEGGQRHILDIAAVDMEHPRQRVESPWILLDGKRPENGYAILSYVEGSLVPSGVEAYFSADLGLQRIVRVEFDTWEILPEF